MTNDPHMKRLSQSSSSGGSEDFDFARWGGIDGDTASLEGESIFPEDDEELDNDNTGSTNGRNHVDGAPKSEDAAQDVDTDDPFSSAALSKKAERILANAKKRLTVMPPVRLFVRCG